MEGHYYKDLEVGGRVIKWVLQKYDFKVETRFNFLDVKSNSGHEHGNELSGSISSGDFLTG
jgi:hypothetical protein